MDKSGSFPMLPEDAEERDKKPTPKGGKVVSRVIEDDDDKEDNTRILL